MLIALVAQPSHAAPGYLMCNRGITVGSPDIMGKAIVEGTNGVAKLVKAGTTIACGGEITSGDSLTFDVSGFSGQYLLEATPGTIADGTCSGTRIADNKDKTFTVPPNGPVTVRVAWSAAGDGVTVSSDCTYTVKALASTPTPTTTPTPATAATSPRGALAAGFTALVVTMGCVSLHV